MDHLNLNLIPDHHQAYLNQKRLDSEAKQLHLNATNFAKQTNAWLLLIDSFNSSLKELVGCRVLKDSLSGSYLERRETADGGHAGGRGELGQDH